jgi:hypothetical protein
VTLTETDSATTTIIQSATLISTTTDYVAATGTFIVPFYFAHSCQAELSRHPNVVLTISQLLSLLRKQPAPL